jgi:hypothetical protein
LKKTSLLLSAAMALVAAGALAGCGTTTYFAGRTLPPSGLTNRVLIAVQYPNVLTKGALEFVDAYYDTRSGYTGTPPLFSISSYTGALPATIQNMPEEQLGGVYGSGDGSFTLINYAKETVGGAVSGLNGLSSSIFTTRNQSYAFAASQSANVLTVVNRLNNSSIPLSLPGIYRVSVNPGGSVALAFVQNNSNPNNTSYVYYPQQLTAGQTISYSGGPTKWPKAAVDCEPQNAPTWCLFQAQSPDHTDATGNYYGAPLEFDHPIKAVFSADGGTAYILNCGPECGGSNASVTTLPIAPMIFLLGQQSGRLPSAGSLSATCTSAATGCTISVPGGASNALVDSSTLYVVGQQYFPAYGLYGGNMTLVDLTNNTVVPSTPTVPNPVSISDGIPEGPSRMLLADDNTLWIGMTKCTNGMRANHPDLYPSGYGCLTMVNTTNNTVTLLEPYLGDLTGIAGVTSLHKIYVAQGGQVYIFSTVDGSSIDNQYVTVTGVASDVAYMDGLSDGNNTVY